MRASHAQEILDTTRTFSSLEDALGEADISVGTTALKTSSIYKIHRKSVTPRELAETLTGVNGRAALVFGREGTGLRNNELDLCDLTLTIPASPKYPTLNISHAAAIIFHELYRSTVRVPNEKLAEAGVKQRILGFVDETADTLGLPDRNRLLVARAFKTMMGRSALRAREASVLAGFFRGISTQLNRTRHLDTDNSRGVLRKGEVILTISTKSMTRPDGTIQS